MSSELHPLHPVAIDSSYSTESLSHHPAHRKIERPYRQQYHSVLVLGEQCLIGGFASLKGPRKRKLGVNTFDTVSGVQVLDKGDLIASGGALARDDGGVGEEEFPDLVLLAKACKPLKD